MSGPPPRPADPRAILALAILLPGMGHVASGRPLRGLGFVLFILLLGAATLMTAGPAATAIGRLSGGLFVWALSIPDAYRIARLRRALWQPQGPGSGPANGPDRGIESFPVQDKRASPNRTDARKPA